MTVVIQKNFDKQHNCKTALLKNFAELIWLRLARKERPARVQLGKNTTAAPDVDGSAVLIL